MFCPEWPAGGIVSSFFDNCPGVGSDFVLGILICHERVGKANSCIISGEAGRMCSEVHLT